MILSRVSPTKGKRVILTAVALPLLTALILGVTAFTVPLEAAAPSEQAAALIYGVGESAVYVEATEKSQALRKREVAIDKGLLESAALEPETSQVIFNLFDNVLFTGVLERDETRANRRYLSGRLLDKEHGYFFLSLDGNGRILAQLEVLEEKIAYVIAENTETSAYFVTEVSLDQARGQAPNAPVPAPAPETASEAPAADAEEGAALLDLLVAYTPEAEAWADANRSGIANVISLAVERANEAFADSEVDLNVRVVFAAPVDYEESGDPNTDLYRATFSKAFDPDGLDSEHALEDLHEWREDYGADLVVLMTAGDKGAAWLMKNPEGDARYGFSVAPVQNADLSLVRQIGYNLGCTHSRNQQESPAPAEGGLYDFSTGARWMGTDGRNYASIMCWPQDDIQVFVFSNPAVSFAGAPAGGYEGAYAPSDNARTLRAAMRRAAAYQEEKVPRDDGDSAEAGEENGDADKEGASGKKGAAKDKSAAAAAGNKANGVPELYILGGTYKYSGPDPWGIGTLFGEVRKLIDPPTNTWETVTVNAGWPSGGRMGHASAVFDNKMWVIGGGGGGFAQERNDIYYSEDAGETWIVKATSTAWQPRRGHTAEVMDNKMWLMGGYQTATATTPMRFYNDVWSTSNGNLWTQVTDSATGAGWSARCYHTSVVFDDKLYMLGGAIKDASNATTSYNDVWYSSNGKDWTEEETREHWEPRFGHSSVVFESTPGEPRMWVIGGQVGTDINNKTSYENDVWSSADGINWIEVTADAAWAGRRDHASVVYDNKLWVIGGWYRDSGAVTDLKDVWWSEDGVTWTEALPASSWVPRHDLTALVFPAEGTGEEGEGEGGEEGELEGEGSTEGEGGEDVPAADITIESRVRDRESLLPLHDWVPLFRMLMSYDPENPAQRNLRLLEFKLVNDNSYDEERNLAYQVMRDLDVSDLLEFGVFFDFCGDDEIAGEAIRGNLDPGDNLLFSFDSKGYDRGRLITTEPVEGQNLLYRINFAALDDPYYTLSAGPSLDDCDGNSFIVAVRTSATWRSQLSLGVEVTAAEMADPVTGQIPRNAEGDVVDSYSPDFFGEDPETLAAESFYSASFGAYDPSGPDFSAMPLVSSWGDIPTANFWQRTPHLAIPLAEFSRPRWNKPLQLMTIATGQFMELRNLLSMDDWTAVVGINLHATRSISGGLNDEGKTILREVNLVLTDVGGDPYGAPGNGGFNPRNALKPVIDAVNDGGTFGHHVVHNGAWVWQDTNNNFVFDAPTPQLGGGVTLNGDEPLSSNEYVYDWEYIPEPPGGGDPWWKIRLGFYASDDYPQAYVEPQPDNAFTIDFDSYKVGSEFSYDYFAVARFDSGFRDCSLRPATNSGASPGAEFRAFIEPRRFDVSKNAYTGGIYVDGMVPDDLIVPWQSDPRWFEEPFWPERTLNKDAAKPFRLGVEVHDMVLTYRSEQDLNRYLTAETVDDLIDLLFMLTPNSLVNVDLYTNYANLGFAPINPRGDLPSLLALWMDPLGLGMARFQNYHAPDIYTFFPVELDLATSLFGSSFSLLTTAWPYPQYAFERRPFFDEYYDIVPRGPRSAAYPTPPEAPPAPGRGTWPALLETGQYPRFTDWDPANARARLLTQKIDASSNHTAMLGINLTGSIDPVVNAEGNGASLAEVNVAFWGPDFSPDILKPLDPDKNNNQSLASGVLLWDNDPAAPTTIFMPRVFFNTEEIADYGDSPLPLLHRVVPVSGAQWGVAPELIDLSGDGVADDLSGDGFVDELDKAWVLTLAPVSGWEIPLDDIAGTATGGMDLFVTVKTSDKIKRFEKFRAVVPSTLPSRPSNQSTAGIQFSNALTTSARAYLKAHGDESPVQEYYGHDMIEANVPMKIVDMTQRWADINIGGAATPVLGLDIATNRADGTRAKGAAGVGSSTSFIVAGANWTSNTFAGDFLVDQRFESYEIVSNTADTLVLRSGNPRSGPWRIVQEPTFLEEVTVELYQEGTVSTFNPTTDLLPLDIDQRISGVALYRDNDHHPNNRNGLYDPDIDIPMNLDTPPRYTGRNAEDIKVRFVFSLPGTRDFPLPVAEQPRNRQWVPDSFGDTAGDPASGSDFIIVLRASQDMDVGDNLRAGVVSYGPNTPTEPDPHIWAGLEAEGLYDYLKFREFPWADRGVGFVTYFKTPQISYFLNGAKGVQRPDTSGYNWLRSSSTEKRRSGVITARNRPIGPRTIEITSVSQNVLPIQTLPGQGFSFVIYGSNFGASPMVALSGYNVTVDSATDTAIRVTIETRDDVVPHEPVTLIVRNPESGEEVSRSDLFSLSGNMNITGPKVLRVEPESGRKDDFPVVVVGENFFDADHLEVHFDGTLMPILEVSADGTAITVGFPLGGIPQPGMMDISVSSTGANSGKDILVDGFEYINPESREKVRFFGCNPADGTSSGAGGDLALLGTLMALLAFAGRRRATRS